MVYVTHDQVEAMTMSDRVAVFSAGQLRQVAEPRRLYEEPDSLFVAQFLGESNALAATVERRDGGQCAATLPGGETIVATAVGACVAGDRSTWWCGRKRWRWARRRLPAPTASAHGSSK